MYNVAALVAVVASFALGIIAIIQNSILLAIADFAFSTLVLLQIYYLRKTKNYHIIAIIGATIVGLFYLYLLLTGGVDNTASLWLFTYPLVTFSLLDPKRGMVMNAVMFVVIFIFFTVLQGKIEFLTEYSANFIYRFLPAYIVISIYSYLFSNSREKIFRMLEDKNKALENMVTELEIKKNKLARLSDELEKRVEERTAELDKAREAAETSERLKTEFLAQMSHEIRSPLNVIMSFIELIKFEVEDIVDEDIKASFDSIDSASSRIIRTIDLILNMTDLQVGSYEINITEVNISKVLNRVRSEYLQSAYNKELALTLDIKNSEQILFTDEYALTQIVSNLVDNAIKYTTSGYIKITSSWKEENIEIKVEDSGIGMSEEFLPSLFNSFTQEEQGYSRSYDGNGLGMALVKKYCDIINTEISVKSKKGVGTTFTLIIPNLKK